MKRMNDDNFFVWEKPIIKCVGMSLTMKSLLCDRFLQHDVDHFFFFLIGYTAKRKNFLGGLKKKDVGSPSEITNQTRKRPETKLTSFTSK